ncbi:hypothetical protein [Pseudomonas peli]|uniref:hypothetical protein n=1 Tax=Pseudomonas peli TaxID=592361 RepID=UPI0024AE5F7D|nr:hypothetical protein [Pseudomonas peli]
MTHESNVAGRDKVNYDRWGIAPSLAFGLGTPTRVNLDYYHLESDDLPDSGIPYTIPVTGSAARAHQVQSRQSRMTAATATTSTA